MGDLLGRQIEDMTKLYNTLGTQQEAASVRELVGAAITGSLQAAGVVGMSIGAKDAAKGATPAQRMGDNINAYYASRTDSAALAQIDIEHIAQGHINHSGKAVGFHHEPSGEGVARISSYSKPPNANGVYEGYVQVQNAAGQWVDKARPSTFFPQSWSEARLNYELAEAFNEKKFIGGIWTGKSPSGVDVQFVPPAGSVTHWRGWPLR